MLNAKALSDLLTKNCDGRLCKRWFVMTVNGTLLAHSEPSDIKALRRQAAVAALSWQEHQGLINADPDPRDTRRHGENAGREQQTLRALTIEADTSNLILCTLQPQLLLALEGGVPPRKEAFEARVTPEALEDASYPPDNGHNGDSVVQSSASSLTGSTSSAAAIGVVRLQRKKLDAMASAIAQHLERSGFKMPEQDGLQLF